MTVEQTSTPVERALKRTALSALHERMGAARIELSGWEASDHFGSPDDEAAQTRSGVGLADCGWLPKFALKGAALTSAPELADPNLNDRASAHKLGRGHYLVTCDPDARPTVEARLDSLSQAPSESDPPPFYTTDVTSVYASFLLAGPRSVDVLRKLTDLDVSDAALPNSASAQAEVEHIHAIIIREDIVRKDLAVLPAYWLLTGREFGEWFWDAVMHAGREFDITPFGLAAQRLLQEGLTREGNG